MRFCTPWLPAGAKLDGRGWMLWTTGAQCSNKRVQEALCSCREVRGRGAIVRNVSEGVPSIHPRRHPSHPRIVSGSPPSRANRSLRARSPVDFLCGGLGRPSVGYRPGPGQPRSLDLGRRRLMIDCPEPIPSCLPAGRSGTLAGLRVIREATCR